MKTAPVFDPALNEAAGGRVAFHPARHMAVGGDAFAVAGVPLATDALALNAGLNVNVTANATLGVSYNGQFGSGVSDHGARANFAPRF